LEEQVKAFLRSAKGNPEWVQNRLIRFISYQNDRATRGETSVSTIAEALGQGLARSFIYFPKPLREQIYQRTEYDSHFAIGMGKSIGYIFNYLSQDKRKQIMDRALSEDRANGFAVGLTACDEAYCS
jgi:hypothetical protein